MKKGFTLMEIVITISILGLMAAFAIPRFTQMQDFSRAGEAVEMLVALHAAQLRYCLEHNCPGSGYCPGNDYTVYDIDVPAQKYNNFPVCTDATGNLTIAGTGGGYQFDVTAAGAYTCTGAKCAMLNRIRPQ